MFKFIFKLKAFQIFTFFFNNKYISEMKLFMIQLCGLFNKLDNYGYLFCIIIYLPINSVIFYMGYLPDLTLEYFIHNKA